jgi:hypothetical protein
MRNQLVVSLVKQLVLDLPHHLQVVEVALNELMPSNYQSARRSFWAHFLGQTATVEDGATTANGVKTADSTHLGNRSEPSMGVDDVPMPHLFLLDMKIGR